MRKATSFSAMAVSAVVVLALSGCGNTSAGGGNAADSAEADESASSVPTPTPSESEDPEPTESTPSDDASDDASDDSGDAVEIEIEGDEVKPNGERIRVTAGEPVVLEIDSDRAGELHVHSTPEQEIPFKKGDSTVELTVDTPGVVDVEEHESGVVLLQLEVR